MTDEIEFDLLDRELRQSIALEDLPRIEDPCVVFEGRRKDSDRVPYWIYTVGGMLDGQMIGGKEGGALVGGDTIIVHAKNRGEADEMASDGLATTIRAQLGQMNAIAAGLDQHRNAGISSTVDAVPVRKH